MQKGSFHGTVGWFFVLLFVPLVFVAYVAYAEGTEDAPAPVPPPVQAEEGEVLLDKAVVLNNDIKGEIDALAEARRLEKERREQQLREEQRIFDEFIKAAKSHRFKGYDITTPSKLKGYQLEKFLAGTNLEGLGEAYAKAEELHGVSAFVLLGISAHESGWGTSQLARERHNLFGYQAYDSNVGAAKRFDSKEDCILYVAEKLAENYLSPDGRYYKGTTLKDVNEYYASDETWAEQITKLLVRLVQS